MGREVRRVALDFDWPVGKIWQGFINPYHAPCPACKGRGQLQDRDTLDSLCRLFDTVSTDSKNRPPGIEIGPRQPLPMTIGRMYWPHPYTIEARIRDPGPNFHQIADGLAGDRKFLGCLGYNTAYQLSVAILKAAGLDPDTWGICSACKGEGTDPELKEKYDAWEPTNPPEGEGWQLWETVSEGSPITKVFSTKEEFIEFLTSPDRHEGENGWFHDGPYSRAAAEALVKHGSCFSMVIANGEAHMGPEGLVALDKAKETK